MGRRKPGAPGKSRPTRDVSRALLLQMPAALDKQVRAAARELELSLSEWCRRALLATALRQTHHRELLEGRDVREKFRQAATVPAG